MFSSSSLLYSLVLISPALTCNSLAPAPVLPIYNQTCPWTNTAASCLSRLSQAEQELSAPPWEALQSRQSSNCHCYHDHCNYFSYRDHIKLTWPAAGRFCQCLGGELVRLLDDSHLSALSFYTLGLVAGTASNTPAQSNSGRGKVQNCHNYLLCLQLSNTSPGNYSDRSYTVEITILSGTVTSNSCPRMNKDELEGAVVPDQFLSQDDNITNV